MSRSFQSPLLLRFQQLSNLNFQHTQLPSSTARREVVCCLFQVMFTETSGESGGVAERSSSLGCETDGSGGLPQLQLWLRRVSDCTGDPNGLMRTASECGTEKCSAQYSRMMQKTTLESCRKWRAWREVRWWLLETWRESGDAQGIFFWSSSETPETEQGLRRSFA